MARVYHGSHRAALDSPITHSHARERGGTLIVTEDQSDSDAELVTQPVPHGFDHHRLSPTACFPPAPQLEDALPTYPAYLGDRAPIFSATQGKDCTTQTLTEQAPLHPDSILFTGPTQPGDLGQDSREEPPNHEEGRLCPYDDHAPTESNKTTTKKMRTSDSLSSMQAEQS